MLSQAAWLTIPALLIAKPLDTIPVIHDLLHTCVWRAVNLQILLLFALCVPVQFYVGRDFFRAAANALRHGSSTMDVLVVLGTTSGFLYSMISIADACFKFHMPMHVGSGGGGVEGEGGGAGGGGQEPSHFFETSAMLISFVLLGRVLEAVAKGSIFFFFLRVIVFLFSLDAF
jgi:Cu+-exporting ATPase